MSEPGLMFPKPSKDKKQCLDMRGLEYGKTNRSQRVDKTARKVTEKCKCRIPNCGKWAQDCLHHIIQKSDTIIDHKLNLIRLCNQHHGEADEFEIAPVDLLELNAHDNGMTVEKLLKTLEEFAGVYLFVDGKMVKVKKPVAQKQTRRIS